MLWTFAGKSNATRGALGALLLTLLLTSCDRGKIQSYQAPKDPAAPPAQGAAAAGMTAPAQIRWDVPSGWQELPATQMRVGSFTVTGENDQKAQVTVIPLAGQAGGDFENVNRWRTQVGQPRFTEAEMEKAAEPVETGAGRAQMYDFAGVPLEEERPTRLLAAILHREGTAWFFKMVGDDLLVAGQKAAFVEFLKSVRFEAVASVAASGGASPGEDPAAAAQAAASTAATPAPWSVPAGWQPTAAGTMQAAKWIIGGGGGGSEQGQAEATVVMLPGDAGGRLANINRWRGQVGLGPVAEEELGGLLMPLRVGGPESYAVDLVSPETQRRMLAAAVATSGQTWFFKLVGDAAVVGREKEAFTKLVASFNHP